MRNLSIEDYRALAEEERRMDSGEQQFVITKGIRMPVSALIMEELGLVSGQTASDTIVIGICNANIAGLQAAIALKGMK